jgi:hypothetical protein
MTWYRLHYSMSPAREFEVTGSSGGGKALIATQGSVFKDALTAELVQHLGRRSAYVKVIDVSRLERIQPSDWDVIVVVHTWEMRKPPHTVQVFVDHMQAEDKLVVLTTSGAGDFKLQGVDAISAASRMADLPARVSEVVRRIDAILDRASSSAQGPD